MGSLRRGPDLVTALFRGAGDVARRYRGSTLITEFEPLPTEPRHVLSADGIDDVVAATGRAASNFTVALHVFLPTDGGGALIHLGGQQAVIYLGADGTFSGLCFTSAWSPMEIDSVGALSLNVWQHIAFTYDGADLRLYRNRQLNNTVAETRDVGTSTSQGFRLFAATFGGSTQDFCQAMAANVRVYTRALSGAEIADIESETDDLVRHYPLDEGTGTTAANLGSDATADGTISGATWAEVDFPV